MPFFAAILRKIGPNDCRQISRDSRDTITRATGKVSKNSIDEMPHIMPLLLEIWQFGCASFKNCQVRCFYLDFRKNGSNKRCEIFTRDADELDDDFPLLKYTIVEQKYPVISYTQELFHVKKWLFFTDFHVSAHGLWQTVSISTSKRLFFIGNFIFFADFAAVFFSRNWYSK